MEVFKHAAQMQLLELVMQDGDNTAEYQERGDRRQPAQAASILANWKCRGCRGSQEINASVVCT